MMKRGFVQVKSWMGSACFFNNHYPSICSHSRSRISHYTTSTHYSSSQNLTSKQLSSQSYVSESSMQPFPQESLLTSIQTVLAGASAPLSDIRHLPHVIFWTWFHVLQFDISNQTLDPEEDEHNKRDRPLPAKRITIRNAVILRWALVPACWVLSACYSLEVMYASIALVALTVIYDEFGAHSGHWAIRNFVNALGFVSFEVGASLIAGERLIISQFFPLCLVLSLKCLFIKETTDTSWTTLHDCQSYAAPAFFSQQSSRRTSRM